MTAVLIPVFGQFEMALECISRIVLHTNARHEIIVIDDGTPGPPDALQLLLLDFDLLPRVTFHRNEVNLGFPATVNRGFEVSGLHDVAIVNSDVLVSDGWLERLIETAVTSDLTATVTAMTNNGANASAVIGTVRINELTASELDAINRDLPLLPPISPATLPTGVGHCMLITRKAIVAAGEFSLDFSPGYGEEVDFSLRASRLGFIHLLCPTVFVWHEGGGSFGESRTEIQMKHEEILKQKYAGYHQFVHTYEQRQDQALTAFMRVHLLTRGMKVLIDGRMLHRVKTGAGVTATEIARALSTRSDIESVTLLLNPSVAVELPAGSSPIKILGTHSIDRHIAQFGKFDVVFRPGQVDSNETLKPLWDWAYRVSILQLDFIAFDNWFYHGNASSLRRYQDAIVSSTFLADSVMYNSEYVFQESQRSVPRMLGPGDIRNLGNGLDHAPSLESVSQRSRLIVVLGSSYPHKNRGYALRLLRLVNSDSAAETRMIMIGANPPFGGTLQEDKALAQELGLGSLVEFIHWLPDDEVKQLISKARIVLYPTISEGFGLVPFEAAANGAAPLFALQTSLKGLAPDVPHFLTLVDIERDAKVTANLLDSSDARDTQIAYINSIAQDLTWGEVVDKIVSHLKVTLSIPPRVTEQFRTEFFTAKKTSKQSLLHIRAHPVVLQLLPPGSRRANYFKSSYFKVFS